MICKYMNSCTAYRTTVLSIGPAQEKYQREICVTNFARDCPIHGDLDVKATANRIEVITAENKINHSLRR